MVKGPLLSLQYLIKMKKERSLYHFILIEDNEIDLFFHEKLISLQELSSSIKKFSSALKALEYIFSFKDKIAEYPDSIILLDIQMPEMDGFEFLKHMEDLPAGLLEKNQIYIVSSSLDYADLSRGKANYLVNNMLEKPLDAEKLKQALGQFIILQNKY